jgi:beta-lactamase class A
MPHRLSRRAFTSLVFSLAFTPRAFADPADVQAQLADLEKRSGGRLGVAAHDLGSGKTFSHRGDERFALCSTFKHLAAAFVLARVDRGEEQLERKVKISKADLVAYSPGAQKHVGSTMTVAELCEASITLSDNAAANHLLASFGGPAGLTEFLRSIGDQVTRLDRMEPAMNEAAAGTGPRDTTTPNAMNQAMNRLVLGDVLSETSRKQLKDWLIATTTGDARIRAGVPKTWVVGDKTGTCKNAANDTAILFPPERQPVFISVYYAQSPLPPARREKVIADAARIVSEAL